MFRTKDKRQHSRAGTPGNSWWECDVCFLKSRPYFRPKKGNFPHPFSDQTFKIHTRFQTCALGRNYVIITHIRGQTNKFFKLISNSHIFLFLSHSFEMETIKFSYIPVVPSKRIPDSRLKWAKCIPIFRLKRRKNPTRWGGTYLYGTPRSRGNSRYSHCFCLLEVQTKFIHQSNQ